MSSADDDTIDLNLKLLLFYTDTPVTSHNNGILYQGVYQLVISIFPDFSVSSRVFPKKFPVCLSEKMYVH